MLRPNDRRNAPLLLAALAIGCVDEGGDRAWGLHEERRQVEVAAITEQRRGDSAEFSVFVPLGLDRERVIAAARDSLTLGKGSQLALDLRGAATFAGGTLDVQEGAVVGSIYGGARTLIGENALVQGYVKTCGSLELAPSRVTVGVLKGSACQADEYLWRVDFPRQKSAALHTTATDEQPLAPPPGAYGEVRVGADSVLQLRNGSYYFESLAVEPRGMLELNNVDGPIYIWVRRSLSVAGNVQDYWLQPSILVGYAGEAPAAIGSALRGTWIATASTLTLPVTARAHSGSFFAKELNIEARAKVELRAFSVAPPRNATPPAAPEICGNCRAAAQSSGRQCCLIRDVTLKQQSESAQTCSEACRAQGEVNAACFVDCERLTGQIASRAEAELEACRQAVFFSYADCQARFGYRPDTCERLGFSVSSSGCDD